MASPLRLSHHTSVRLVVHGLLKPASNVAHQPTALLFRLPPSYRAFHASPRPQAVIETLLLSSHALLTGLHTTTQLSWALTIPLAALLLRLSLTLPATIISRMAIQARFDLQPLVLAWSHHFRRQNMARSGHLGPAAVNRGMAADVRRKRAQIYSRWRCGLWKDYLPLLQLPMWILMLETLRGMVGSGAGLLSMLLPSALPEKYNDFESAPDLAAAGIPEAGIGAELVLENSIVEAVVPVEPSLATEGMLWFPDLMAADPVLVLPFMLSGVMLLNTYSGQENQRPGVEKMKGRTRRKRALGVMALAVGPIFLHVPTAMLLYWVSSSFFAYGQSVLLDRYMPMKWPLQPCKPKKRSLRELDG